MWLTVWKYINHFEKYINHFEKMNHNVFFCKYLNLDIFCMSLTQYNTTQHIGTVFQCNSIGCNCNGNNWWI